MSDATPTPTPLPCPYCGSESIYIRMGDGGRIRCFPNGCTISPWCDTEAEAVTRWNAVASLRTRAELAEGERDRLFVALLGAVRLANTAFDYWDADNEHKVGKYLNAMAGHMKGYHADATAIHEAIAATDLKSERKDVTT